MAAAWVIAAMIAACSRSDVPAATPAQPLNVTPPPSATLTPVPATPLITSAFAPTQTALPASTATPPLVPATLEALKPPYPTPVFADTADCARISRTPLPLRQVTVRSGDIGLAVQAEAASTDSQRTQGLMCRTVIPPGTGMLFFFDRPSTGGFWMFNTYAPIDLLYIDGTGRVVSALTMKPCPRSQGEDSSVWEARCGDDSGGYRPSAVYSVALELPAGWLESNGVPAPFSSAALIVTWQ